MRGTKGLKSATAVLAVLGVVVVTGCGGSSNNSTSSGSSSGGTPASGTKGGSINVAIVDNPQMKDIAKLTPSLFTAKSGIKVNYTVLDEGTLRQVTTRDVAAGGRQFDVAMIG
ncbi:MAG: polyol transport system substrate-binding protein, partial [Solirubrobacteraceae bacterium]|nr:polyol transport system substrate-binding protein [Solirubrobacteraceae bacterium]